MVEFLMACLLLVSLFGIQRCTSKDLLEINIKNQEVFELHGIEFKCLKTEKQKRIELMYDKIKEIREEK